MSYEQRWKEIGTDVPSLLPLQAVPQEWDDAKVLEYLQSLHNYLREDRQKVVRSLNVLSRFRLLIAKNAADIFDAHNNGAVIVDGETGAIFADPPDEGGTGAPSWLPIIPEFSTITKEPTGFVNANADTTIGYDEDGDLFTIAPTGTDYTVYLGGFKFVKNSQETMDTTQINSEGIWYIYFDSDGILQTAKEGTVPLSTILSDNIFVAIAYHDGSQVALIADERHGLMPWQSHYHKHVSDGTLHVSGLGMTNVTTDGNGNLDIHAEAGAASGVILDEDLPLSVSAMVYQTTEWWTASKVSAGGLHWEITRQNYSPTRVALGVPQYNRYSGGNWTVEDVPVNNFFLSHIFATNFVADWQGNPMPKYLVVVGEDVYLTKAAAREGANTEIANIVIGALPTAEFVPVATMIFKRTGTNSYGCAAISTDTGDDYVSWLAAEIQPGSPPSSHANLTHRDDPDQHPASSVSTVVTNFNEELSAADTTVQLALDTLDAHEHAAGLGPLDYIDFDTAYADGVLEGRLQWNIDDGVLEVGLPGGTVNLQIGSEMVRRVRNVSGVTIPDGAAVYQTGVSGIRPTVALADASTLATARVIGVATEEILNNSNGYITLIGLVRDQVTTGMTPGGPLWLSATTPGALTETKPDAPNSQVAVASVEVVHATAGSIHVHPVQMQRLQYLADVYEATSSPSDGEAPVWIAASSRFEMQAVATASHTHLEADITDLGSYLPLSAGSGEKLTGDLYFSNSDILMAVSWPASQWGVIDYQTGVMSLGPYGTTGTQTLHLTPDSSGAANYAVTVFGNSTATTGSADFSINVPGGAYRFLFEADTGDMRMSAGDLFIEGAAPSIFLRETADAADYTTLWDNSSVGALRKIAGTGAATLRLEAAVTDGTSGATIQLFRTTNTTGARFFRIHKGDGTSTVQHSFNAGSGVVELCNTAGSVTIGEGNLFIDKAADPSIQLREGGTTTTLTKLVDDGWLGKLKKIGTGTVGLWIDAESTGGTGNVSIQLFREANTTGTVKFVVHEGDGTSTANHELSGGSGNADLCKQGGKVICGGVAVQLPYLNTAPSGLTNGMIWMESDGLHIYYSGAEKTVAGV
jgi:hypothetical protein